MFRFFLFSVSLIILVPSSFATTCSDGTNGEDLLREVILTSPGTGSFFDHVKNKDKSKACYEVGQMAGKIAVAESFILRCHDPQLKGKITVGLQACKGNVEKIKEACISNAPKSFSANERLDLGKDFWGVISSLMKATSKCLESEMWKSLPQRPAGSPESKDGTTGAR